jgi:homoserine O-acetyltransferase/O-succinyltransferase
MNKRNYDKRILQMIINLRKRNGFPLLAPAIISGLAASSVVFSQAAETTGHVGTSTMASGGPLPTHADAWYENYQFRDGQTLAKLRIH